VANYVLLPFLPLSMPFMPITKSCDEKIDKLETRNYFNELLPQNETLTRFLLLSSDELALVEA
jgi:hypothetical protein